MVKEFDRTYQARNTIQEKIKRITQARSIHLQMSRVTRTQHKYDDELAGAGKRRSSRCEYVITGTGLAPVVRELVIDNDVKDLDPIPWWKRQKPRRRRKS